MTTRPIDASRRVGDSLEQLRQHIDILIDTAASQPGIDARGELVDVHHQLRLLGQHLNTALAATTPQALSRELPWTSG
ncbi:hypothetical protein [Micromonospora sp. LOL_024]|uniref:hypothetical protein n=1 Tax=Micromonospora sp. LOL_024 TaxID=3345412 RepID=UPI003A8A68C9